MSREYCDSRITKDQLERISGAAYAIIARVKATNKTPLNERFEEEAWIILGILDTLVASDMEDLDARA